MSPRAANATANSSPSTLASRKNGGRPEVSGRRPLRSLLECDRLLDLLARDAKILRDPLDGVAGFHPASDDFGSYPGSRDDRVAEGHSGIDGDKPVDVGDDDRKEADRAGCVFRMCCIEKACSRRSARRNCASMRLRKDKLGTLGFGSSSSGSATRLPDWTG